MSKKSRKDVDIRRGQYEFPGFAAGVVAALVHKAIELVKLSIKRRGGDPLLEGALGLLAQGLSEIEVWQRMAQMITDYDAARREVESHE